MSDSQQYNNIDTPSEEVTLKELIQKVKSYGLEIKRNWLIVAICSGLGVAAMLYKHFSTPKEYAATLTFMVNEKEGGGGLAGAASILGALSGGGTTDNNLDKILTLSKSMRIIQQVVLLKQAVDGKNDYLANHVIEQYDFDNTVWKKNTLLKGFRFMKSSYSENHDSMDNKERTALKAVYARLVGGAGFEGLMSNSQSRQTQIMTMNVTTTSDELSVVLSKCIFEKLSQFYIDKTIEREKQTFNLVREKTDSIRRIMIGADYASARFEDRNRGLILEQVKVPVKQLARNSSILNVMYAEAVKNMEVSDFALKNSTPFVQPIDIPFSPLGSSSTSLSKAATIGIIVGFFLSVIYLIVRKLIKESLK